MSYDPPGYRPDRTYPDLVGHPYPDSSKPLRPLDVIRSFRVTGEQMWDEDVNNMEKWLGYYAIRPSYFWREPRAPFHAPFTKIVIADPQQKAEYGGAYGYKNNVLIQTPFITIPLQVWAGVKSAAFADRIVTAFSGEVWRGVAIWQPYKDVIEISCFVSQVRKNEILASYKVVKPFYFDGLGKGCRMRGWPRQFAPMPLILKNGAIVGEGRMSLYSSGAVFSGRIEFQPGDVLSIKAPDSKTIHGLRGFNISLVGGLM